MAQQQNKLKEVNWTQAPGTACDGGRIPVTLVQFQHALRLKLL